MPTNPRTNFVFIQARLLFGLLEVLLDCPVTARHRDQPRQRCRARRIPEASRIRIRLRRAEGSETYCPTPQQVTAMIDYCRDKPELNWFAVVLMVLVHSGLRFGEAAGLRWPDIDFRSNTINITDERSSSRRSKRGSVRTVKGRRDRSIPLHPALRKPLKSLDQREGVRILHDPTGGPLTHTITHTTLLKYVIKPL